MIKVKRLILVWTMLSVSQHCLSQENADTIDITFRKTTSIVFSYPIINVDRGSSDVLAQKVKDAENILQVKASRRAFAETNLTVITADGTLHHFYVHYVDNPLKQVYSPIRERKVQFAGRKNRAEFEMATNAILHDRSSSALASDSKFRLKLAVKKIYIDDELLFIKVQIRNRSSIAYDVESLRFFIRDRKKVKRTAVQEIEIHPVYVNNAERYVSGKHTMNIVYAFQRFTIADAKVLDIELFERNGGRHLKLRLDNRAIVKANTLPNQ